MVSSRFRIGLRDHYQQTAFWIIASDGTGRYHRFDRGFLMAKGKSKSASSNPTMKDVAKLAGVSQSTVSRVLNDSQVAFPISDETRQKIMEAVETLGYHPNMIARSLRTQRTGMIAVMIGDISNAFYHPIVRAVQDIAGSRDYDVLISNSDHVYENERRFLDSVLRRPVDGVIMAPHRFSTDDLDGFIMRSRIPIVALGAQVKHPLVDVVGGTSEPATCEAITWLIREQGHQRIGFMGVAGDMPPGPARLRGYERAMHDAGLPIEPGFIQKVEFTMEGGHVAMYAFLQMEKPPTAIFACNSLMAIGAMVVAQAQGFDVPQDFSVMGFDDIPEATIVHPALTIVARDLPGIGRQVAEILFERIDGRVNGAGRFFQTQWQLTERQSVRRFAADDHTG
ncbi:MAG TPA: LacI family DNA-binding transcriptional regulator [Aggregatilineales bacterium]|nr:LacI family DNA-binding transcriptional regulator [Aggregatilineales bacterium]